MAVEHLQPLVGRLQKLVLYESFSLFLLVGCDKEQQHYRVLKIQRDASADTLAEICREEPLHTKQEITDMLEMVHEGNRYRGGLRMVTKACGVLGFVRFLGCYHLILITQKKKVGCIAGNNIYTVKSVEMFPIRPPTDMPGDLEAALQSKQSAIQSMWSSVSGLFNKVNKTFNQSATDTAESRYVGLYQFLDVTKDFYFSYSYDLTHSLQYNTLVGKESGRVFPPPSAEEMFEWNRFQAEEFRGLLGELASAYWTVSLIHGSFQQRRVSLFGQLLDVTLIARRSRHYAGTRYLKRGVSDRGKVANDVEMEQIFQLNSVLSSFVQARGSIPTFWSQETSVTNPKPPIILPRVDPSYSASVEHFADLIRRYGAPVIVLDLVKQQEKRKREGIVGREYRNAVQVINSYMPKHMKIRYCALDFSRISKSRIPLQRVHSKHMINTQSELSSATARHNNSASFADIPTIVEDENENDSGDDPADMDELSPKDRGPGSTLSVRTTDLDTPASVKRQSAKLTPRRKWSMRQLEVPTETRRIDVLQELDEVAVWSVEETGFFCSKAMNPNFLPHPTTSTKIEQSLGRPSSTRVPQIVPDHSEQRGVLRTNCIDCLDRTNVAQFAAAVHFSGRALAAMGLSDTSTTLAPSHPLMSVLMEIYSEMGDRLALQYGGSEAHKKVSNTHSSQSSSSSTKRMELLTSIRRYYSNAFTDRIKQDAMNLFLGYFIPKMCASHLWDIDNDFYLHNELYSRMYGYFRAVRGETISRTLVGNVTQQVLEEVVLREHEHPQAVENQLPPEIIAKYTIRRGSKMTPELMEKLVRSEARKAKVRRMTEVVSHAEQLWWRSALQDNETYNWVRAPPPEHRAASYFDRVYKPGKLTSFEKVLGNEFADPKDVALDVNATKGQGSYWKRLRPAMMVAQEDNDADEYDDNNTPAAPSSPSGAVRAGTPSSLSDSNSPPQRLGRYVRNFSQRAKLLMKRSSATSPLTGTVTFDEPSTAGRRQHAFRSGGVVPADTWLEEVAFDYESVGSRSFLQYHHRTEGVPAIDPRQSFINDGMREFNDLHAADSSPSRHAQRNASQLYSDYVNMASDPEQYSVPASKEAEQEFKDALRDFTVSSDNIGGMQRLAEQAHASREVNSGPYVGCLQLESAIGVSFKVLEGVEIAQRYSIPSPSPRRGTPQSPTAPQPVLEERVWSTNANITGLSETGKAETEAGHLAVQQLLEYMSSKTYAPGVRGTALHMLIRERLVEKDFAASLEALTSASPRSTLTTDRSALLYSSLACPYRDTLGLSVDQLRFVLHGSRSKQLQRLLAIAESRRIRPHSSEPEPDELTMEESKKDLIEMARANDYPGFTSLGDDLFAKDSNPYFLLNEVGVITFLAAHKHISPSDATTLLVCNV